MATLTLGTIKNLVRDELNEFSETAITSAQIVTLINDGYKDVAAKGLCYEKKISFDNITAAQKVIYLNFSTNRILRVNHVEYKSGSTQGGWGALTVFPQTIGHTKIDGNSPQYWFQWGDYIYIEPSPDVSTYDLDVYASCFPDAVLSSDSGTLTDLPEEFHECVYDFVLAFACFHLKRWADAANNYNRYIIGIQVAKREYIAKRAEGKSAHELPSEVTREAQGGR